MKLLLIPLILALSACQTLPEEEALYLFDVEEGR
jgi:hypothetical protein